MCFFAVAQEQLLYVHAGGCGCKVMELQEQCLPAGKLEGKVVSYNRKESGSQKKVWFCGWSLAECAVFCARKVDFLLGHHLKHGNEHQALPGWCYGGQWPPTELFPGKFSVGTRNRFFILGWVQWCSLYTERPQDLCPQRFSRRV